jgi:hypothetical protein
MVRSEQVESLSLSSARAKEAATSKPHTTVATIDILETNFLCIETSAVRVFRLVLAAMKAKSIVGTNGMVRRLYPAELEV